jgi:hypothetical protein
MEAGVKAADPAKRSAKAAVHQENHERRRDGRRQSRRPGGDAAERPTRQRNSGVSERRLGQQRFAVQARRDPIAAAQELGRDDGA